MSHQSGVCHLTNPHKWLQIMQWATYIPEWVADLLSGLVDIIFAYALYIGMKQQTKPMSGLLITNIIITVVVSFLILCMDLISIADEDYIGILISLFVILGMLITSTIIGVQFIRHFNGLLNKLGWGMLASLIIVIFAAALISEDEFSMTNTIISFIEFWIISYILYIQAELLTD